jgi:hypothetical protein
LDVVLLGGAGFFWNAAIEPCELAWQAFASQPWMSNPGGDEQTLSRLSGL